MAKNATVTTLDDALFTDHAGNQVHQLPNGRLRVSLSFSDDPGLTEQAHKDSCDISYILNQFIRTGQPLTIPDTVLQDYTSMPDYQTCLNMVNSIDDLFDSLPAKVKLEFDQDPSRLMDALNDPTQRQRLIDVGVLEVKDGLSMGGDSIQPPVVAVSEEPTK